MYNYSFDETRAGDWRLSRAKYEHVHECYVLLLKRIDEWNQTAVAHGALEAPYKVEAEDLQRMIEWGNEELREKSRHEIVVKEISVGSMRYTKAALIYGASLRTAEAQYAQKPDWPAAVRAATQDVGKPLLEIAEKIKYPAADILNEVAPPEANVVGLTPEWDAFISHASEDKAEFVEPLARELQSRDLKIWYDNFTLTVGDSLRRSIDRGLAHSKHGVVILSPNFFAKEWPQKELDGLVAREIDGRKIILPVWHNVNADRIRAYSPILADKVAISSARGVQAVADAIVAGMRSSSRDTPALQKALPITKPSIVVPPKGTISVDGHVESYEQRALGRFSSLRERRIDKSKGDPYEKGYWQASFALQGQLRDVSLNEFLEVLRRSKTGRTGWDIGWVPTREEIQPYPYQKGIEAWLAEEGGKGPAHSDFWRAENIGTFSLFRGYEEDDADFSRRYPKNNLDYSLALWRVSEFLLYLENFASNFGVEPLAANIRFTWTGLENRRLGNHNIQFGFGMLGERICRQQSVESTLHIENTSLMKKTLIRNVQMLTRPLFEVFDFFTLDEEQVKALVQGLFDADKEGN